MQTHVAKDKSLIIHEHERLVNVYSDNPKDDHNSARTVYAAVCHDKSHSGQSFNLNHKPVNSD